jgi:hypothetical protein
MFWWPTQSHGWSRPFTAGKLMKPVGSLWYSKTVSIHTNPLHLCYRLLNFCASFVESPVSWLTTFKLWLSRFSCTTLVPLREPVYS